MRERARCNAREKRQDMTREKKEETVEADNNWCNRLEIGAGGGLVGLAVANGCSLSQPLHITDQLEMLSLMGHNVLLNNAQGRVKPMILNWCVHVLLANRRPSILLPVLHVYTPPPPSRYPRLPVYRPHWQPAMSHSSALSCPSPAIPCDVRLQCSAVPLATTIF